MSIISFRFRVSFRKMTSYDSITIRPNYNIELWARSELAVIIGSVENKENNMPSMDSNSGT